MAYLYGLVNPKRLVLVPSAFTLFPKVLKLHTTLCMIWWSYFHIYILIFSGGFLEFQATHTSLCESKTTAVMSSSGNYKCPPLTSMSQPCLPVSNIGPTKILPFLFLGSQHDALSRESMQVR